MTDTNLPVEITKAVSKLADKLPLAFVKQLDEWAGDAVRERRFRSLVGVLEKAVAFAEEHGLDMNKARTLALHVGLPWIDKASLCEDDFLQEKWAGLLVSMATGEESDYGTGATYVRIQKWTPNLGHPLKWDLHGYQAANSGVACLKYTAFGVRRSSAL